jgi:hypothetical protein
VQEEFEENVADDDIKPQTVASNCDRSVARTYKVGCCVHGTNRSFIPEILHIRHFSLVYRLSCRMWMFWWNVVPAINFV